MKRKKQRKVIGGGFALGGGFNLPGGGFNLPGGSMGVSSTPLVKLWEGSTETTVSEETRSSIASSMVVSLVRRAPSTC